MAAIEHGARPAADNETASGHWRYVAGHFSGFLAALEPRAVDTSAAVATATTVNLLLRRRFPLADADTPTPAPVIIGGYDKNTAVRDLSGVDLAFVLPDRYRIDGDQPHGGRDAWNAGLREMTRLLAARFAAVGMSRDGWLSITAKPTNSQPLGVRIVPAFRCGGHGFLIPAPVGTAAGKPWRLMIPRAERSRLDRTDSDTERKARHLIRMLKVWRYAASIPIASFALELLACEFLSLWTYRRRSPLFYDWMVRDFFFWMGAQAGRSVGIPGSGETLALGDAWLDRVAVARAIAAEAADLERDNEPVAAISCWRRIFGGRFAPSDAIDRATLAGERPAVGTLRRAF